MEMGNLYGMDFLVLKRVPILSQRKENGDVVSVIDPAYEKEVKDKVFEVFSFLGEQGVNDLYEMMVQVLEDEKMVSWASE